MMKSYIGIFDSGLGGLTVAKAISESLPQENLLYLGDTARVPYGTRTGETISQFALEMVDFLLKYRLKALVVACNTISANALPQITKRTHVPVINVIDPTIDWVVKSKYSRVGVIGTNASISTHIYRQKLQTKNPNIEVFEQACPLFVPLIEENFQDHPAAEIIAEEYLTPLKNKRLNVLILGCTHYPMLKKTLAKVIGQEVALIDSAGPTASALKQLLSSTPKKSTTFGSENKFFLTDRVEKSLPIVSHFWPQSLTSEWRKITL